MNGRDEISPGGGPGWKALAESRLISDNTGWSAVDRGRPLQSEGIASPVPT